jgi:outer membrane protein OmpA-like peptidoglycan-associated protein
MSRRVLLALAAAVGCGLCGAAPAAALTPPPQPPGEDALQASVTDLAPSVTDLAPAVVDLQPNVRDLDTTSTDGATTVVSLSTDVLFEFARAVLPPAAPARLTELTTAVPRGAAVQVHGFTDSIGSPPSNLELSGRRADAVATAIRTARPDLALQVEGFGEDRPLAPNTVGGKDNPDGRAKNRRVELRYGR